VLYPFIDVNYYKTNSAGPVSVMSHAVTSPQRGLRRALDAQLRSSDRATLAVFRVIYHLTSTCQVGHRIKINIISYPASQVPKTGQGPKIYTWVLHVIWIIPEHYLFVSCNCYKTVRTKIQKVHFVHVSTTFAGQRRHLPGPGLMQPDGRMRLKQPFN